MNIPLNSNLSLLACSYKLLELSCKVLWCICNNTELMWSDILSISNDLIPRYDRLIWLDNRLMPASYDPMSICSRFKYIYGKPTRNDYYQMTIYIRLMTSDIHLMTSDIQLLTVYKYLKRYDNQLMWLYSHPMTINMYPIAVDIQLKPNDIGHKPSARLISLYIFDLS